MGAMIQERATGSDARVESPSPGSAEPQAPKFARSLVRFVAAAALTSLCLWAYLRAGAGAAGLQGYMLLFAPVALLVSVCLLPGLRNRGRAGWPSLLVGIALPFALVSCELREWVGRKPFDAVAWKAAAGGRSQERIRQVDALMASGTLDRRSRFRVTLGSAALRADPRLDIYRDGDRAEYVELRRTGESS
jgi:hypothetical protein